MSSIQWLHSAEAALQEGIGFCADPSPISAAVRGGRGKVALSPEQVREYMKIVAAREALPTNNDLATQWGVSAETLRRYVHRLPKRYQRGALA